MESEYKINGMSVFDYVRSKQDTAFLQGLVTGLIIGVFAGLLWMAL